MNTPHMRWVDPTRLLHNTDKAKQLKYVPSVNTQTDGVLARWMRSENENNADNYPDDQAPKVDAAGTFLG